MYRYPPPEGSSEAIGSIYLGDDAETTVAGFRAGYLLWRTTKAADWLHEHIGALIP